MDYVINDVPFEMAEISEQLFNKKFLSDIIFIVDGKQIFAHSLELMKRSTVFMKQLEPTLGEKKLITITNYVYNVFYQFVRFIYTDKCDITPKNSGTLLNLAKEYKVTELVKVVRNVDNNWCPSLPVNKMKQMSCNFFNLKLLSDITFIVEGKKIYAHSLELMKRSTVFQQQLEPTIGEKKQIPISDYGYDTFYQFLRFIYTDECDINGQNCFELFKLAVVYKIVALINFTQNSSEYDHFKLVEFCVLANDQVALFGAKSRLIENIKKVFVSDAFLSARHETVAEILKFDQMGKEMSEMDIFNALVRWMKHHCKRNAIEFSDCREKFKNLIRLVRFPTLSNEELKIIETTYTDLLTENDILNIRGHKIYGADYESGKWNCIPRLQYPDHNHISAEKRIRFSVNSVMILSEFIISKPFVYNSNYVECDFERINIKISHGSMLEGKGTLLLNININNCDPKFKSNFYGNLISLGSSISFQPGLLYSIEYKYLDIKEPLWVKAYKIVIHAPPESIKISNGHNSIMAMRFLCPYRTTVMDSY